MPRSFRFPAYPKKKHRSGQARIRIRGRDYYLGVWNSEASRREYARLAAEFAADPRRVERVQIEGTGQATVDEIVIAWADENDDGGKEAREILRATGPLLRLFGPTLGVDFDTDRLEIVRRAMVDGSWMLVREKARRKKYKQFIGWALSQTNHMIMRIKKIWRWAERKKLVPKGSYFHLTALAPLKKGVRKTAKVRPADEASVEAVMPRLKPIVAAMVNVGQLTGLRPEELCEMAPAGFRFDGPHGTWLYGYIDHKTAHVTGEESVAVFGPKAQEVIKPYLESAQKIGPDCPIWRWDSKRGRRYTRAGFYRAIQRTCDFLGVKRFTSYQLRHLVKLKVTQRFGLDGARAVLRQKSLGTTNMYAAQQDVETAARIAKEMG